MGLATALYALIVWLCSRLWPRFARVFWSSAMDLAPHIYGPHGPSVVYDMPIGIVAWIMMLCGLGAWWCG